MSKILYSQVESMIVEVYPTARMVYAQNIGTESIHGKRRVMIFKTDESKYYRLDFIHNLNIFILIYDGVPTTLTRLEYLMDGVEEVSKNWSIPLISYIKVTSLFRYMDGVIRSRFGSPQSKYNIVDVHDTTYFLCSKDGKHSLTLTILANHYITDEPWCDNFDDEYINRIFSIRRENQTQLSVF